MRSTILVTGAAVLLCSAAAFAQTSNSASPTPQTSQTEPLRNNIRDMLQKEGFKDIRLMPSSFMIRANDKNGNPVVMTVSPDSFTEVTELSNGGSQGATAPRDSRQFVSIPSSDELSSNLVGLDIYNNDNKDIGTIKDIAMNATGQARAYLVSVGGFLGIGEHYVAVNPAAVKISYTDSDKKWHASMNATADQLKAAPEFKYTGRWSASHT